jgi:hypothetical protein
MSSEGDVAGSSKGDVGRSHEGPLALALEDLGGLDAQQLDGLLQDVVLDGEQRNVVHGHDSAPLFALRRDGGDRHGGVGRRGPLGQGSLRQVEMLIPGHLEETPSIRLQGVLLGELVRRKTVQGDPEGLVGDILGCLIVRQHRGRDFIGHAEGHGGTDERAQHGGQVEYDAPSELPQTVHGTFSLSRSGNDEVNPGLLDLFWGTSPRSDRAAACGSHLTAGPPGGSPTLRDFLECASGGRFGGFPSRRICGPFFAFQECLEGIL